MVDSTKRQCIIHIGMPKTGTTSVQNALFENREYLLERFDVNYWHYSVNHSPLYVVFHSNNGVTYPGAKPAADRQTVLSALETSLANNTSKQFVLSAERFSNFAVAAVENMHDFLEPHFDSFRVCIYVREPFGFAASAAQQQLKGGATFKDISAATLDETPPKGRPPASVQPNYRARIEKYQNVFGRENVSIFEFKSSKLKNGDAVADFLERVLGVAEPRLPIPARKDNPSLGYDLSAHLEKLNRAVPIVVDGSLNPNRARNMVGKLKEIKPSGPFVLKDFDYDRYVKSVASDVAWLSDQTDGEVSFSLEPPAIASAQDDIDSNLIVAYNDELVAHELSRLAASFYREAWHLTLGRSGNLDNVLSIVGKVNDAKTLWRFANDLLEANLNEPAAHILKRLIDVAKGEGDEDLARRASNRLKSIRANV